ncbi:MAG: J domain-containing protein [Pseudomonadota bacterium]
MRSWDLLGIEPTQDLRAIKRAYSVKLKTTRPDDDAEAYQQLREAYDWAQQYAKFSAAYGVEEELADEGEHKVEPLVVPHIKPEEQEAQEAPEALEVQQAAALEPTVALPETTLAVTMQEDMEQTLCVESLVKNCVDVWAEQGSAGLVQAWPGLQALLEDLPIAEHSRASRAFAQFVVEQPQLPIEVLTALTRYFQWGQDFRVDQMLGPTLAHAVAGQLNAADVFVVLRPEKYAQHAWALALVKLWDQKRGLWLRLLAAGLDCPTRARILQAKPSTLQALGASPAAITATQKFAALGGKLQGIFFALLVLGAVAFLYEPGSSNPSLAEFAGFGLVGVLVYFFLYDILRYYQGTQRNARPSLDLRIVALVPVLASVLLYLVQRFGWLAGYLSDFHISVCLGAVYFSIWMAVLAGDDPWSELLLPTFALLVFGVKEYFPTPSFSLLMSLAFSWTMGAHVVLRLFPERFDWVYDQLLKLGLLRTYPLFVLGAKFLAIGWALMAVVMLPALLFRMAANYRVLYAGAAIYAGVLLCNVRSTEGQTHDLLAWVLGVVLCMQLLQALVHRLAEYGLKKARVRG